MALTQPQLTLDEFLMLPEDEPALEYEDGVITQKVSPQGQHSALQYASCHIINRTTQPGRIALALPELRATFAGRSYVPDVAVYRWSRIPRDEKGRIANRFVEPPDIAIEIVSPEQTATRLVRRCLWYVSHGAQLALLIDPTDEAVLLFRPGAVPQALTEDEAIDLSDVIPGFSVTVRELFDQLLIS